MEYIIGLYAVVSWVELPTSLKLKGLTSSEENAKKKKEKRKIDIDVKSYSCVAKYTR